MKKEKSIYRIGDFLENFLEKKGLLTRIKEEMAIQMWREIVGEEIFKNVKAEKVKNGILYVKCKNPSWKQEVNFKKEEIIKKLNKFLKKEIIKDIKYLI
jgi:predicted nucleic acid-binding Zn ribbon protein